MGKKILDIPEVKEKLKILDSDLYHECGCVRLHIVIVIFFFWIQGDVESIASKNPKELTALIEQISGSEEYKRPYEELEVQKAEADEKAVLAHQKKKTISAEKKQKKLQKEEAERHLKLQEQLVHIILPF